MILPKSYVKMISCRLSQDAMSLLPVSIKKASYPYEAFMCSNSNFDYFKMNLTPKVNPSPLKPVSWLRPKYGL